MIKPKVRVNLFLKLGGKGHIENRETTYTWVALEFSTGREKPEEKKMTFLKNRSSKQTNKKTINIESISSENILQIWR